MKAANVINVIDTHTAGEPTRIINGGLPHIPGDTMTEKRDWFKENLDKLRSSLILEPRGHGNMFGAIITEPVTDDAEAGLIFLDTDGYLDMCGHGTIGVTTALVETGTIMIKESSNDQITFNTPAGEVDVTPTIHNGEIEDVTLRNVASFWHSSEKIDTPNIGKFQIDISYGGNFFALVNVTNLGIKINPSNVTKLVEIGLRIRETVNSKIDVFNPVNEVKSNIDLVEFYDENMSPPRSLVVFGSGQVDRSPCGSGTSAKMALLYKEGRLDIKEKYRYQSVLGTEFTGQLLAKEQVNDYQAVIPAITGRASITSFQRIILQDNDPLKYGFQLN